MPRTKKIKVYKLDELSGSAKERAMQKIAEWQVYNEWWDCTFDDAKRAGIKIDSFDTYRQDIDGQLIDGIVASVKSILVDHGETCETYKTAKQYQEVIDEIECAYRLDAIDDDERDEKLAELEPEYLREILGDYLIILRNEYEYLTSEEAILETCEANGYEFDEYGRIA